MKPHTSTSAIFFSDENVIVRVKIQSEQNGIDSFFFKFPKGDKFMQGAKEISFHQNPQLSLHIQAPIWAGIIM